MAYRKSRLARTEERKAKRSAFVYIVLTIVLVLFAITFGFGFVSRFASFVLDLRGTSDPIEISDNTPPAPPRIDRIPEFTNKTRVSLKGSAEPGASVTIVFNGTEKEVVADDDGSFSTSLNLNKGANTLYTFATDINGNKSVESSKIRITFDNESPELTISKPEDGKVFFGPSEQTISIEGNTEIGARLTINDRVTVVGAEGVFSMNFKLEGGENILNIKATDRAGNETETVITVTFSP